MIVNRQRRVPVALKPLEEFLGHAQQTLQLPPHDVAIRLVSDAEMARLNRLFRGKRGATDVLSFPADGDANGRGGSSRTSSTSFTSFPSYLGDIAISPETARRNARRFERPLSLELRILILHGLLHLVGFDHETDSGEMERLERRLRRRLGLS